MRKSPRRRALGGGYDTQRRGKPYAATGLGMKFDSGRGMIGMGRFCVCAQTLWITWEINTLGFDLNVEGEGENILIIPAHIRHIARQLMDQEPAKAAFGQIHTRHICFDHPSFWQGIAGQRVSGITDRD